MKERPILFSAPMVRALLAGTKTQTRRVVKAFDAFDSSGDLLWHSLPCPYGEPGHRLWVRETWRHLMSGSLPGRVRYGFGYAAGGKPKWSKHTTTVTGAVNAISNAQFSDKPVKWRPSIHMPRRASRITLEVTGVRIERLQAISEEDAKAEGAAHRLAPGGDLAGAFEDCETPINFRAHFRSLWESINGAGSWDANPWVWVIEFRRMENAP